MSPPRVEIHTDHLLIKLEGVDRVAAMKGSLVVPYSTIASAAVASPEWPAVVTPWRLGTHLPGVVAKGTFREWNGRRRFLDIDRGTKHALKLQLHGHPDYDEVELDVADAPQVVAAVAKHRPESMTPPPVYE